MPRDDEKLLRQLSLVSFLLDRGRPATPAEIQDSVEGYALMTDDAFARRFYADREDLARHGIAVEATGETDAGRGEAYYLPAQNLYLPDLALAPEELAGLSAALVLLEGRFPYARPLRLALLSLGGGHPLPTASAMVSTLAVGPDRDADRVGKTMARLEDAVFRGKTVRFDYRTREATGPAPRVVDPYGLHRIGGHWYLVGRDHERAAQRMFRLGRISGTVHFTTRNTRDFHIPPEYDPDDYGARPPWLLGEARDQAVVFVAEDLAWWVSRSFSPEGAPAEGGIVFTLPYADPGALLAWVISLGRAARLVAPPMLVDELTERLHSLVRTHKKPAPPPPGADQPKPTRRGRPRRAKPTPTEASVPPERLARAMSLLAYLLESGCDRAVPLRDIKRDLGLGPAEVAEDVQLLSMANHGGGTYLIYAAVEGDEVIVSRELMSDALSRPMRLSPLMAKSLLLALDLVGDLLPAAGLPPLTGVRSRIEALVEDLPSPLTVESQDLLSGDDLVLSALATAAAEQRVVRLTYYHPLREELGERLIEPLLLFHTGTGWYLDSYCRQAAGQRTFRLDLVKEAALTDELFTPHGELETGLHRSGEIQLPAAESLEGWVSFPAEYEQSLAEQGYSWAAGQDGRLLARIPYLDGRWLVREVLRYGGDAVLEHPEPLRALVAERAAGLLKPYEKARREP